MIIKHAAISHSKLRNEFGIVGVEADTVRRLVTIKMAEQWSRKELNRVPTYIKKLHNKKQWDVTYIDQSSAEHLINELKQMLDLKIITTKKNMNDPKELKKIKVMDKVELVQWMLTLLQNKQLKTGKPPTDGMKELYAQLGVFSENTTEAGGVDYFAPGDQYDNLVKALMIACFSVRKYIDGGDLSIRAGSIGRKRIKTPEDIFLTLFPNSGRIR